MELWKSIRIKRTTELNLYGKPKLNRYTTWTTHLNKPYSENGGKTKPENTQPARYPVNRKSIERIPFKREREKERDEPIDIEKIESRKNIGKMFQSCSQAYRPNLRSSTPLVWDFIERCHESQ